MNDIIITNHAEQRLSERFDLTGKRAYSLARRAWNKGKTADEMPGFIGKRLKNAGEQNVNTVAKAFGRKCFVFSDNGVLITAFDIEEEYELQYSNKAARRWRYGKVA